MAAQKPTFRVMKNGYDRFAVDEAIDRYAAQVDLLERKLEVYQEQLIETARQLEETKAKVVEMQNTENVRKEAADSIARLSLREANEIINTAQNNADEIIREALSSARGILEDLTVLYREAGIVKSDASGKLEHLLQELDAFSLPEMPDLMWLKEAEEKLR